MDGPQEYEVGQCFFFLHSIGIHTDLTSRMQSLSPGLAFTTRGARKLHGYDSSVFSTSLGLNRLVQKYYVKWKGYDWDECTWEPTDSFQGGSEHILESFWERIDTGGRDISDATAFKKGEELLISGPPGRKGLKRKANPAKTQLSPSSKDIPSPNGASISAPPLGPRKRRRVQITAVDEWGLPKPKRRVSTAAPENGAISAKSPKRRRVSSPGPRKSAPKRLPSAGDSQLDADGETDPDIVEVEDELMQVSAEDAEEDTAGAQDLATASGSVNGHKKISFDDLEHFYSDNPIDIDQNTDESVTAPKPEARPQLQSPPPTTFPPPDDTTSESQLLPSPTLSSPDPLFDSPSRFFEKAPEIQKDPMLPHHRARVANPLVKLIDTTTSETSSRQSRITAKARLMSIHTVEVPSTSGPSRNIAKRGGKPGPSRSSSGLVTRNRSSLLTATKGTLKSIKGNYTGTTLERDVPDEIEDAPVAGGTSGGEKLLVTSWSDEDVVVDHHHQTMSGDQLLKLAGLQTDPETLPDYEDDSATQPQKVEEIHGSSLTSAPAQEELPNQSSVEIIEGCKASDQVVDASPSVSEAGQQTSIPVIGDPSDGTDVAPPADEAVKKNIELAKEHLFPSTQSSFNSFGTTQSSFQSTIFGPLYQGSTVNSVPAAKNEFTTTFKVILSDNVELPLILKDCGEIKARISDILIGNSSCSKVALFYAAEDALAMVSTLKSNGTARVVLDPSAKTTQQERFSTFLQRFESSQTLIAPVGKEVCVLYSSENTDIAEKLGAPTHLRGLSSTLLISRASIENQLAYVAVIMKAPAV
ncbi:hypothetical protein J3R82DRAFT_5856 [Butyriboletus roseoflavus]|nr:hypothetical protein J3R82DRAFT_5856 [Butyriboletus roseoflavus]